jgi:ribonuclease VapC
VTELGVVVSARLAVDARPLVIRLLDELQITTIPFSDAHWRTAIEAFWRYGRGRHRAGLNFGDCITYAVASLANEPLLFLGDDFTHTDLTAA